MAPMVPSESCVMCHVSFEERHDPTRILSWLMALFTRHTLLRSFFNRCHGNQMLAVTLTDLAMEGDSFSRKFREVLIGRLVAFHRRKIQLTTELDCDR